MLPPDEHREGIPPAAFASTPDAVDRLLPAVYEELRGLAARLLRRRPHESLKTTSLIHEAYLRMARNGPAQFESRGQFFGVAAKAMRCIHR